MAHISSGLRGFLDVLRLHARRLQSNQNYNTTRDRTIDIPGMYFLLVLLGRCERTLNFRFYLQLCLGFRTPSIPCLRACFFDRSPRGSREPASDGCSPGRATGSLAPPTSAATPNLRDICRENETRTFYFLWSWKFV